MSSREGPRVLAWITGGTIALIVLGVLALHYHREEAVATRLALQTRRLELVERMRAGLASAADAEKSAVMATTDEESQAFAEQSRAASAMLAQRRDELGKLLEAIGTREERDLLSQFSRSLEAWERTDREVLDLSVRNTNLKAYALAFGPAADAIARVDGALSRILAAGASTKAPSERMRLAAGAQSAALRIQALLAPHIFEESDQRMDELESKMATEDREVRSDLEELAGLLGPASPDLEAARSGYAQFSELRTRILELSRQNTNVRSLILSLNQARKETQVCQDALDGLNQAIQAEPPVDRLPESPR